MPILFSVFLVNATDDDCLTVQMEDFEMRFFFCGAVQKGDANFNGLKSKAWPFKYKREYILFSGTILFVM